MRTQPYAQGNAIRQPADLGSETPFACNKTVTDLRTGSQKNIERVARADPS